MNAVMSSVGARGIDYVKASFVDGLPLARNIGPRVTGRVALAYVPQEMPVDRVAEFARGGLGRSTLDELARHLADRYSNALLVVELPLLRPPELGPDEGLRACGDDVYATADLRHGWELAGRTLRSADPAYLYNAFVLTAPVERDSSGCPDRWVSSGASDVLLTITGAYDGEGFVLVPMDS